MRNIDIKIYNMSFQTEISETSYGVIFTFKVMNITMPEDPDLRSSTFQQVQDVINNAVSIYNLSNHSCWIQFKSYPKFNEWFDFHLQLNTLLNEPDSMVFAPISSNFT